MSQHDLSNKEVQNTQSTPDSEQIIKIISGFYRFLHQSHSDRPNCKVRCLIFNGKHFLLQSPEIHLICGCLSHPCSPHHRFNGGPSNCTCQIGEAAHQSTPSLEKLDIDNGDTSLEFRRHKVNRNSNERN